MAANVYGYVTDYSIGSLSAGTHTIKVVADSTGAVGESYESDNEYTKTITVQAQSTQKPNLKSLTSLQAGQIRLSFPMRQGRRRTRVPLRQQIRSMWTGP